MQANVIPSRSEAGATDHRSAAGHLHLTQGELQQLGMFRVAYLVGEMSDDDIKIMLHSADGMTLAVVDTVETAVELADQLGLALVAVH